MLVLVLLSRDAFLLHACCSQRARQPCAIVRSVVVFLSRAVKFQPFFSTKTTMCILILSSMCGTWSKSPMYTFLMFSLNRPRRVCKLSRHQQVRPILAPVRPLHCHRRTRQVHLQVQHQSEVTNPHQETCAIHQKLTTKKKKRDNNRDLDDRLRDLPELLEEFTENLEDTVGEKVEGTFCKKEKNRETARVRSQGSLKETAQGGDLSALETNRQGEDPRTFKVPVERWRVQKKWKGKKKKDEKRKVKYRRRTLWKKAKERIASFLAAKWRKEGWKE